MKRYRQLSEYNQEKYHKKVYKISLNGGFTCPNKDGKLSKTGCIYCSKLGSGDFAGNITDSLETQFLKIKEMMASKWHEGLYIAYFQANTNTYASVNKLKEIYEPVLKFDEKIIGLAISTRPDCLSDEILNYLEDLNKRTELTIELGLQSMHEETLKYINRQHDLKTFDDAVLELAKRHINVVVHIINGLPNETKEMMLETIEHLNHLPISGIKIHMLHVMKDTILGDVYLKKPFKILTLDEYIDIVTTQIEHLRKDIIIHRLTGDAPKDLLIAPLWTLKKFVVLNNIDKELIKRDSYQGKLYKE